MHSSCEELGIPEYLHKNNRPEVSSFEANESLYRRFSAKEPLSQWKNSNAISASIFEVKNDSFNRSKFSYSPEDVLYNTRPEDKGAHYFDRGILEVLISKINAFDFKITQNGNDRIFTIKPVHKPEPCMYPHSEIHVLENNNVITENKPKSTKASIRDFLIDNSSIIKYPE